MQGLQRVGALAAGFCAFAYIAGFAALGTVLDPGRIDGAAQRLAFVLERKAQFQAVYVVVFMAFGIALVALAAALHERLAADPRARTLMPVATPIAMIWAGLVIASGMIENIGLEAVAGLQPRDPMRALSTWTAVAVVQEALGGGIELVGGVWMLLVGAASLRTRAFARWLDGLAVGVGLAGILTVVPALKDLAAVFGLGQIAWFGGIALALRGRPRGALAAG